MKLAVVFLFTFPGTPCIYYGDEIGLTGGHDPDCRKCMEWEPDKQNQDLFTFYQDLIQIRLRYSALRTGTFRFLSAEADCTLLGYSREDDTDHIIILMNNSDAEQSIEVPVTVTTWENIYSGEVLTSQNGSLQAELPPYGYLILRSEGKTF